MLRHGLLRGERLLLESAFGYATRRGRGGTGCEGGRRGSGLDVGSIADCKGWFAVRESEYRADSERKRENVDETHRGSGGGGGKRLAVGSCNDTGQQTRTGGLLGHGRSKREKTGWPQVQNSRGCGAGRKGYEHSGRNKAL